MLYDVTLAVSAPQIHAEPAIKVLPVGDLKPEKAAEFATVFMESTYWNCYKVVAEVKVLSVVPRPRVS